MVSNEELEFVAEDYRKLKDSKVIDQSFGDYLNTHIVMKKIEKRRVLEACYERSRS